MIMTNPTELRDAIRALEKPYTTEQLDAEILKQREAKKKPKRKKKK